MIQQALETLFEKHQGLSFEQARESMEFIMSGNASDAQIGAFLAALRVKGESVDELAGFVSAMREKCLKVEHDFPIVLDTCGTGGDGKNTFNISTAAAFVAAGAGAIVAKHGNRAVSSSCGSADVLKVLGVDIGLGPESASECLKKVGMVFLAAPVYHKAMKYVMNARKELGSRTVFNILGPMVNPARANVQVLGVCDRELARQMASVLARLGTHHAYVVHGMDGTDEISVCDRTYVCEVWDGQVVEGEVCFSDFGMEQANEADLAGGDAEYNAKKVIEVLEGKPSACLNAVLLNAGFALSAARLVKNPELGVELAREVVTSGKAMEKLEQLKAVSCDLAKNS